jgi:hypothetical protein
MLTPEQKVKARLRELAKKYGAYRCAAVMTGRGSIGTPDELWCLNGVFLGIEAKADRTKKATAPQKRRLEEIRSAGGTALLVHKDNMTEFEHFLKLIKAAGAFGIKDGVPADAELLGWTDGL